ncbi:MAG: hypothetical protein ACLTAI_01260 [Thomasclavelia sp.]
MELAVSLQLILQSIMMPLLKITVLIYSNSVIRPNALVGSMSRIGRNCTVAFNTKIKAGSDIEDGSVIKPSDEYSFEVGV